MTKSELIEVMAQRGELPQARAEEVVNVVFDAMVQALVEGQSVEIRGFGTLSTRPYGAYTGRNPHTGQQVSVAAKRLPYFKVAKELREIVNGSRSQQITGDTQRSHLGDPR